MNQHQERLEYRCKHYHNGYEHPKCFDKAHHKKERIGFLDIETEDLKGSHGVMFCWCIKDANSNKIYEDCITSEDVSSYKYINRNKAPKTDKRIIQSLIKTLFSFDRIVGHYHSRFDLPFIRTRAVICGVDFPAYGSHWFTDTWVILKNKFKLNRNTLENGSRVLVGYTEKDHLSHAIKLGCLTGNRRALKETLEHCRKDVRDTERLYNKVYRYAKETRSCI